MTATLHRAPEPHTTRWRGGTGMQVDPTIGGIEAQVGDRRGAPMQRWCRIATASAGALCWAGAEISLDHGGHAAHGLCDTWTGELLDVVFE